MASREQTDAYRRLGGESLLLEKQGARLYKLLEEYIQARLLQTSIAVGRTVSSSSNEALASISGVEVKVAQGEPACRRLCRELGATVAACTAHLAAIGGRAEAATRRGGDVSALQAICAVTIDARSQLEGLAALYKGIEECLLNCRQDEEALATLQARLPLLRRRAYSPVHLIDELGRLL